VILGASIAPFLAPPVIRFEQDRTGVAAATGYAPAELDAVTGALIGDLLLWRGDFDVAVDGTPALGAAERSHMRDVRGVFTGFWLAVLAGVVVLVIAARSARALAWRAAGAGARSLAVLVAVAGAVALIAFDAAFELFHRLFFSGNYTFDPATDKLVQLFPMQFWSEIAIGVGVVAIAVSVAVAWVAGRRSAAAGAT
jgi:integral membrane protein (TIGR01906 family)